MKKYDQYKNSGVEWLGEIPEHWEHIRMKHLFKDHSEKNKPNEELLSVTQNQGVVPRSWVENRMVMPSGALDSFKFIQKGDFAISLRSFEGGLEYCHHDGIISPAYTVLKTKRKIVEQYYKYLFKSFSFITELQTSIVGIREGKNISYPELSYSFLPVPKIEEQNAIAKFLDKKTTKIDQAIAIKQKQIELLKERRQILIHKVVTRGLNENVELKDSGVVWIGEIPEHWDVKKIKDILIEKKKTTNPSLNCGSISYGKVVYKNNESVLESTKKSYQVLLKGEFLINPLNLNYDLKSLRIALSDKDVVVSSGYIILNTKIEINKTFLNWLLHRFDIDFLKTLGAGVRQTLNYYDISRCELVIPPIIEQEEISEYIETANTKIESAISLKEQEIGKLKEYKMSLIDGVVTGKVKVS